MRRLAALLALALAALGCSAPAGTPEDRVRAVLAALQAAAEARDVGAMKDELSASYKDAQGNDRRAVLGIATAHFLRNRSVYLLSRVGPVEIPSPGFARAEAFVALAGTPIHDAFALPEVRADLYRFDVRLAEESGTWRVISAAWQPATLEDFR
jgi:hypothetical protein